MKNYIRFGVMILTSTIVMYFMMFLNTYEFAHVMFSETRVYMAITMGAGMAIIMLLFMWKMYENKRLNYIILLASVLIFSGSLWLVRSQATIDDTSWMSAMIPHHSIAIMTSKRADLNDPRVKELSEDIIEAQEKEIKEMKELIEDIKENGIQEE